MITPTIRRLLTVATFTLVAGLTACTNGSQTHGKPTDAGLDPTNRTALRQGSQASLPPRNAGPAGSQ